MKKILILCYDFYPYNSIGSQRAYSWFRYFKQFNLYPIVVTRHWDNDIENPVDYIKPSTKKTTETEENNYGTIIRTPYKPNLRDRFILKFGLNRFSYVRRAISLYYSVARYTFRHADTTHGIHKAARNYLQEVRCDGIIATGEPYILFKYAHELSHEFKIPWIADYRDLWSTKSELTHSSRFNFTALIRYIQRTEKKYLSNCTCICTASPSYKKALGKNHPNKQIEVVFNGFDSEKIEHLEPEPQNNQCFEIAYSGQIYPFQPLETYLEGYKNFIAEVGCKNTRTVFYGVDFYPDQTERLLSFNRELNNHFVTTNRYPHNVVLQKLRSANAFLLLADTEGIQLAAKVFEYLALNRKIMLVIDDKGVLSKIVDECNGGIKCSTPLEVTNSLKLLYSEYMKQGYVEHQSLGYDIYSRQNQCRLLANIIKDSI